MNRRRYTCVYCNYRTYDIEIMRIHMSEAHNEKIQMIKKTIK